MASPLPISSLHSRVRSSTLPSPMAALQSNHIVRDLTWCVSPAFTRPCWGSSASLRQPTRASKSPGSGSRNPRASRSTSSSGTPPSSQLPRRHHLAFPVADYDGFVTGLKARGTELFEKTQPDGRTRQVFFFDPDERDAKKDGWRKEARVVAKFWHRSGATSAIHRSSTSTTGHRSSIATSAIQHKLYLGEP